MSQTAEFVARHGYALLFFWILAEQGAVPLPSIPLLLVCGALIRSGALHPALVVLSGGVACLLADSVWFELGRIRGRRILGFLCRMAIEPDSCVRQTETGFAKYGIRFLLVSKFVPGINALAGPLAGSARVPWPKFLAFDAAGAVIWIGAWATAGFLFSEQLEDIARLAGRAGMHFFALAVVVTGSWIGWKFFQRRRFLKKIAMARITPADLEDMFRSGEEPFLIDVRGGNLPDEELVEGALRIPTDQIGARYREIPRDRDVILFCT